MPLFVLYFSGNQNQQQQGGYQNNQQGWSKYQLLDKGMRETRLNCHCLYFIHTNDSFLFNTLMPLLNTWKLIAEMAKGCTFFYLSKFFLFFFLPVKKILVFCLDQLVFTSHCLMTGVFHINCSKDSSIGECERVHSSYAFNGTWKPFTPQVCLFISRNW